MTVVIQGFALREPLNFEAATRAVGFVGRSGYAGEPGPGSWGEQVFPRFLEAGQTGAGMLAGLSHPRLRLALVAMHENPAQDWSLEALAARAGMSRSVFANAFRDTVGCTPGAYLQRWRIGLAEQALRRGRTLALIADEVGYGGEAALSRAFKAQTGLSPRQWREAHKR